MSIAKNIKEIRENIPDHVTLVCVSKFHDDVAIMEAYNAGERVFGESRVQELTDKYYRLPQDINWHFIGHLQTNKVKYLIPVVTLIHGVDSVRLAEEINKQAVKHNRLINCLLQVHIATEESKFGFSESELISSFDDEIWSGMSNINICGLMGMATFTDNTEQVRNELRSLKKLFDIVKAHPNLQNVSAFNVLSMGMSDDYQIAIEEGSTMVRIGSSIFGHRNYHQ